MNILEIKESLVSGDMPFLAKSTGYSYETIKKVLDGERKNDLIVNAAKILIEGKKSLATQIAVMCGEEELVK